MSYNELLLHCGAIPASLEDVMDSATPPPDGDHYPIPHGEFVHRLKGGLESAGSRVVHEAYALWKDGARLFGILHLQIGDPSDERQRVIGLRGSHDKYCSRQIGIGERVLVCDNLSFIAEVKVQRKHTRWISRDLPHLVGKALAKATEFYTKQDERIAKYKDTPLTRSEVNDIVVQAMEKGAIKNSKIPAVLAEWEKPQHEVFEERNAWSLLNAFTEVAKEYSLPNLQDRTGRTYGVIDQFIGL